MRVNPAMCSLGNLSGLRSCRAAHSRCQVMNACSPRLYSELMFAIYPKTEVVVLPHGIALQAIVKHGLIKHGHPKAHAATVEPFYAIRGRGPRVLVQNVATRPKDRPAPVASQQEDALECDIFHRRLIKNNTSDAHNGGVSPKAMLDCVKITFRNLGVIVNKMHYLDTQFSTYANGLVTLTSEPWLVCSSIRHGRGWCILTHKTLTYVASSICCTGIDNQDRYVW